MIKFISSKQFFLPVIYICIGIISFEIISKFMSSLTKVHIKGHKNIDKKKITITSLIKNIIKYLIAVIVLINILNVYGINTSSIIAGLGVAGVVIGLAFEDLIKDLIAGIFIIFDNDYEVGDYVSINGFTGEVISVGLKTTKLKALTGEVKVISNSTSTEIINYSMYDYSFIIKIAICYEDKISKFEDAINAIKEDILNIKDVKKVELLGIDSYEDSSMTYAISITCNASSQYRIKRSCLKLIKEQLDKKKIVIPYNKLDINIINK